MPTKERRKLPIWFKTIAWIFTLLLLISYLSPFVRPTTFWLIPYFGLIYPILFLLVLLCLLFAVLRKSSFSLVLIFALLVGGNLHFRLFVLPGGKDSIVTSDPGNNLRVMSYNVRLLGLYDWIRNPELDKREAIVEFLEMVEPDVVCFQEFYHEENSKKFPTRDLLIPKLYIRDYYGKYSEHANGKRNFGILTLSKFPIVHRGFLDFESTVDGSSDNYCTYVDIQKGNDTLRIYNVHLQSIKFNSQDLEILNPEALKSEKKRIKPIVKKLNKAYKSRANQAELVVKHAQNSPHPVVICGDFNDTPMSYVYNCFSNQYKDAFRSASWGIGSTYVGKLPAGRIDYIFTSDSIRVADFRRQNFPLSDHRAIWTEVNW